MSNSEQEHDRWESCPPGTLARTVRGIQSRRRDRQRASMVGVAGGAVAVVFAVAIIAQQMGPTPEQLPHVSRITCATVQSLLPAYVAGKLEAAVTDQVDTHLDACPHCRERYEKAKNKTASLPSERHRPLAQQRELLPLLLAARL